MGRDNGKQLTIDVIDVLGILAANTNDSAKLVLTAAIDEMRRLRTIETAVIAATSATTKEEKTVAWQKLTSLVQ